MSHTNCDAQLNRLRAGLWDLAESKGPAFLETHPVEAWESLQKTEGLEPLFASLGLTTLLAHSPARAQELDEAALRQYLAETCFLSDDMAQALSGLYKDLFSKDHLQHWKTQENKAFQDFISSTWESTYEVEYKRFYGRAKLQWGLDRDVEEEEALEMLESYLSEASSQTDQIFMTAADYFQYIDSRLQKAIYKGFKEFLRAYRFDSGYLDRYDASEDANDFLYNCGLAVVDSESIATVDMYADDEDYYYDDDDE